MVTIRGQILLVFVALAVAVVPGVAASARQPPDCRLMSEPRAQEHAIPGTSLVARSPHGGLLSRKGPLRFDVRGSQASLDGVALVVWALDGVVKRFDDRGPSFQWFSTTSLSIPAGEHIVEVSVVQKSGTRSRVNFSLVATDCGFASFHASLARRPNRGHSELFWDSKLSSGSALGLTTVAARGERNVLAALPSDVRGQSVGAVTIERPRSDSLTRDLRAPRHGNVLLRGVRGGPLRVTLHPDAKEFITVTGLPAGTVSVRLTLRGPGTRLVRVRNSCRPILIRGVLRAASTSASQARALSSACATGVASTPTASTARDDP